jgi:glycosyltransferase XagB
MRSLARISRQVAPVHGRPRPIVVPATSAPAMVTAGTTPEAETADLHRIDPARDPADPALIDRLGARTCLRTGLLPWRRVGGTTIILSSQPGQVRQHQDLLTTTFGPVRMAYAGESVIRIALLTLASPALVKGAECSTPAQDSCRTLGQGWKRRGAIALPLLALAAFLAPETSLAILIVWTLICLTANTALKLAAIVASRPQTPPRPARIGPARLPVISLLVPLFRESEIAASLIRRISALDYPRDRLDLCIILEADDAHTRQALSAITLPPWAQIIEVPAGNLRTKPRALNYALPFARGAIIGIYDAEDVPAPDHLHRVVDRFAACTYDVACLQGVLDYFNPRANWLARCFTLEYAAWFRVILPGLKRLNLVVPLGGTTLFLRREALEGVGGWDAHNVTEDADLGLRLARYGYHTETIPIVTLEEANAEIWPWIRQRSRWLKGYAMTWAVHMRNPVRLWRDLGPRAFLGVQVMFLGALTQLLFAPLIWSFWAGVFGLPLPLIGLLPPLVLQAAVLLIMISGVTELTLMFIAAKRAGKLSLALWSPALTFYHPLATFAAWRGLLQAVRRPFFWDKTRHGLFAPAIRQTALPATSPPIRRPAPLPRQASAG